MTMRCVSALRSTRPFTGHGPARHVLRVPARPRPRCCRAEPEDKAKASKSEEYAEAMKKLGVDSKTAQEVLKAWKETGIQDDPNALRKMFLKQSVWPISAVMFQSLLDGTAAYALHMTAIFIAIGPPFFGRDFFALTLDFIATYFAVCVFFDIITLGVVLFNTIKLQTSPQAFYEALQLVAAGDKAGLGTGLKLVEKVKSTVNAVKVSGALDAISKLLEKTEGRAAMSSVDTLQSLSSYLTLYRAESQHGFDPKTIGMTEADAGKIALVFAQYDADDNGRIDLSEFRKLLSDLGSDVSEEEAKAALEAIDVNKDGYIRFDEFATWWAKRKGLVKEAKPAAAAGSK